MPFWAAVGLVVGKALIRGINIPSVLLGEATLLAGISKLAFGATVPIPTCASVGSASSRNKINR